MCLSVDSFGSVTLANCTMTAGQTVTCVQSQTHSALWVTRQSHFRQSNVFLGKNVCLFFKRRVLCFRCESTIYHVWSNG